MAAILVRNSDGVVLAWGDGIDTDADKFVTHPAGTTIWMSSVGAANVVTPVSLPDDIGAYSYTYDGAFTRGAAYKNPVAKPISDYAAVDPGTFVNIVAKAVGPGRSDQLLAKSLTVQTQILTAWTILRSSTDTLGAIAYLKTGSNPLTDAELAAVDAEWAKRD